MQTIAIVNEKGGTGKTTTAVNLSAALGELERKVLLVDLDGQAASSRWLGVENDTRFAEALWSGQGFSPLPDVIPGVSLAPGSGKLDSVAHDLRPTQGGQLRKLLSHLTGFDYVVIDCPPSLGNRLIGNALLAATHAVVPVETSILALDGLKILLTTFEDIREGFGHEIILTGVVACRYDARTKLSRMVLAELKRALPGKVFQTVIRENVRLRECPAARQSILAYAPNSHGAADYRSLARELLGEPVAAFEPAVVADQAPADELTEEESLAVAEVREHLEPMRRQFGPEEPAGDSSQSEPPAQPSEETSAEPPGASVPRPEEISPWPTWQGEQAEKPEAVEEPAPAELELTAPAGPSAQEPRPEQHEPTPAETHASGGEAPADEQTVDVGPAELEHTASPEPEQESQQDREIGPADIEVPAGTAPRWPSPPAETDAPPGGPVTEETPAGATEQELPPSQPSAEPEVEEGWTWQEASSGDEPRLGDILGPAVGAGPVADQPDRQEDQTWEVPLDASQHPATVESTQDAAPNAEANPLEDAADTQEDYPALRAMLQRMGAENESEEAALKGAE